MRAEHRIFHLTTFAQSYLANSGKLRHLEYLAGQVRLQPQSSKQGMSVRGAFPGGASVDSYESNVTVLMAMAACVTRLAHRRVVADGELN